MKRLLLIGLNLVVIAMGAMGADSLDLAGEWRLRLDPDDLGVKADWPAAPLVGNDRITLPNTTDLAGFGFALDTNTMLHAAPFPVTTRFPGVKEPVRADAHGYLVRRHLFVSPAWYEREIDVPETWRERQLTLRLERTMWKTEVWVDGRRASECDSLVAEHRHKLGALAPGRHRLTVRVDNRMIYNISTVTHAYGPETQTRWNGLIGALKLEAANPISIQSLAVFPALDRRSVRVEARNANSLGRAISVPARFQVLPADSDSPLTEFAGSLDGPVGATNKIATVRLSEPARPLCRRHDF